MYKLITGLLWNVIFISLFERHGCFGKVYMKLDMAKSKYLYLVFCIHFGGTLRWNMHYNDVLIHNYLFLFCRSMSEWVKSSDINQIVHPTA